MKRLLAGLTLVSVLFVVGCEEPKPTPKKDNGPAVSNTGTTTPAPVAPAKSDKGDK